MLCLMADTMASTMVLVWLRRLKYLRCKTILPWDIVYQASVIYLSYEVEVMQRSHRDSNHHVGDRERNVLVCLVKSCWEASKMIYVYMGEHRGHWRWSHWCVINVCIKACHYMCPLGALLCNTSNKTAENRHTTNVPAVRSFLVFISDCFLYQ